MPLNHSLVLLPIILLTWWALFNFHPKMLSQHALNGLGALALLGMGLSATGLWHSAAPPAALLDALAGFSDLDVKPRRESS